jgi:hypothetical protein
VLLQVVDIPNSMTVLPELIPLSIQMVSKVVCAHGAAGSSQPGPPPAGGLTGVVQTLACLCEVLVTLVHDTTAVLLLVLPQLQLTAALMAAAAG